MEDYSKLSDEELSMLVAEKVMGWTVQDGMMHGKAQKVAADAHGHTKHSFSCGCSEDFHPTTDIADAMIVVEKMDVDGWAVSFINRFSTHTEGEPYFWRVRFYKFNHDRAVGVASDLPRAICLAALATVSNQEERT